MPKKPGGNRIPSRAPILFRSAAGWAGASLLAVGSLFLVKFIGFSNLAGAQTTMGAFGLAGGFAHSLLVKSVGGKVSGQQELLLSIVWALSFLCGVTPLFFTSGMELKMAVITFYSFATFGALGGVATAFLLRRVFERPTYRGMIPCVLIWSFSLGFATVAGNAFGEGLQKFLPDAVAWSVAFVTMVLIIGAGSGYSLVQFLEGGRDEKEAIENRGIDQKTSSKEENKRYILVLILLTGPFFLNDFLNIYIQDWRWWLLADYTSVKLFPLLVVFWSIRSRKMLPSQFGLAPQPIVSFAAVFLVGSLATTFIGQNGYLHSEPLPCL